ncbi:PepSY domain-containing protein [Anaerosalibacter massiliensis]|uniref:PepSY domain-containing protein n=1 Tax=Anaerosalibacter massiliensis TaxID=1347392 RepID=A0A9X2MK23_9FIRM|nr:PepSY domain-containing protein [Anaerosalibacter massiliensis]MCR2042681.1 PepSY domain-containing protein [Anaerosalibacter massiliensis]
MDNHWRIHQISGSEAIEIALRHVPGEVLKVELDTENGILVYEITIRTYTGMYYEVKIDANTGEVIEIEREFN